MDWLRCVSDQREMGTFSGALPTRKLGKDMKQKMVRQRKKVASSVIDPRTLTAERAQFQAAKVKELI